MSKEPERFDPFALLRTKMAAAARERVLKKPHDKSTWKYKTRPPLRFRASESGSCPRQIWYRLNGYVPTPGSPELMLKQLWGNVAQDVVRELFRKYDVPIGGIEFMDDGTQKELLDARKDYDVPDAEGNITWVKIAARADGEFPDSTLFEFKTLDSKKHYWMEQAFKGHWKKYGKGNDASVQYIANRYPWYYDQVQITRDIFEKKDALFGFQNRDRVEYDSYVMAADNGRVAFILQKFAMVKRAVESGAAPAPILAGSAQCSWCSFHYQCHGAQENGGKVVYPE